MLATVRTDVCIQLLLCLSSCIALRLRFATTFVRAFALSRILTFAFTFAIRAFALSRILTFALTCIFALLALAFLQQVDLHGARTGVTPCSI